MRQPENTEKTQTAERHTMTMSETSAVSVDKILIAIIEIVASSDNEIVKEWARVHSVIVNLAIAKLQGYCDLTENGEDAVRSAFTQLADGADIPKDELVSYLLFSE
jgi:hypothetical protein